MKAGAHVVLGAAARFYVPLIALFALALLADRAPGGGIGFVAGLAFGLVPVLHALVFGAGLLVRTLQRLTQLKPGFDATHVITATLSLQDARYETNARVNQLFDRSLDGIRQVPGVERFLYASRQR